LYGIRDHTRQLSFLFLVHSRLIYPDRQRRQHLGLNSHVFNRGDRRPILSVLRCGQGVGDRRLVAREGDHVAIRSV
jgi:hypothetical protein